MKNRFRLLKIMALALLLAFSFTACDELFNFSEEENPNPPPPDLPIYLQYSDCFVVIGSPQQLKIYNSVNKQLIWTSSNPGVATVSDRGVVQGISSGKALISVITSDGKSTDSCNVTIIDLSAYVIENETAEPDEKYKGLKDQIWLMFAEQEYMGNWMANYIKTNKIKIVLSDGDEDFAWIRTGLLEKIYLNAKVLRGWLDDENGHFDGSFVNTPITGIRERYHGYITHETMHLDQYRGSSFSLMAGMRPDICAAAEMLAEFLAWFYTETRLFNSYVYADTPNATALQSRYMILSCDPWEYDNEHAKDPSLPPLIHSTHWFNNNLSGYAQRAFTSDMVFNSAFSIPLHKASREDILRLARSLLACRDPQMAGVTDEALMYVFDALRKAAVGDSKYMFYTDDYDPWAVNRESFARFQDLIAQWDANYAARQN